jgi:hypothetical protein
MYLSHLLFHFFCYVYVHISDTNQQTAAAAFSSMAKAKEYINANTKILLFFLLNIFYTHFTIASTTGTAKIYADTKSGTKTYIQV